MWCYGLFAPYIWMVAVVPPWLLEPPHYVFRKKSKIKHMSKQSKTGATVFACQSILDLNALFKAFSKYPFAKEPPIKWCALTPTTTIWTVIHLESLHTDNFYNFKHRILTYASERDLVRDWVSLPSNKELHIFHGRIYNMLNVTRTSKESWQARNKRPFYKHKCCFNVWEFVLHVCICLCISWLFWCDMQHVLEFNQMLHRKNYMISSRRVQWPDGKCDDFNIWKHGYAKQTNDSHSLTRMNNKHWMRMGESSFKTIFNMGKTLFKQVTNSCRRFKHLTES